MKALLTIFLFLPLVSFAQFRVFENLDQLQNGGHGVSDEVVFVKGYATVGDGGEGFFMYDPNATKVFGGMFIAPITEEEGRWVRINYDFVRVNFFGANGSDDLNDTAAIQKAIDFAHENGFPQILIPKGTYLIDSLTIKNGTKIKGHHKGTIIKSIAEAKRWYEDNNPLIKIDDNAVTNVLIENLTFNGSGHNKVCFLFEAIRKDDIHAGLWKSSFKNIEIINFNNHGIYLKGGSTYEEKSPNQFISFENVRVKRNTNAGVNSLRIEGQNAQLSFLNCTFDSERIEDDREATGWNIYIGSDIAGNGTPAIIKFDTCTIQNAIGGFGISAAENINIENCWFENIKTAIRVSRFSRGIAIERNRFANASGFGRTSRGYILYVEGKSNVTFEGNVIVGKYSGLTISEPGSVLFKLNNFPDTAN